MASGRFVRARRTARRVVRLTARGTGLTVAGGVAVVGAYAAGRDELLYVGVLLLLLPLSAVLLARFRRFDLRASRVFSPPIVASGQPATVELTVENLSPIATPAMQWRDYRPWARGSDTPGELRPLSPRRGIAASARDAVRLRYQLTAPQRGVFEIGPMTVVLADPFGLARGEVAVGAVDPLIVTPRITALGDNGLAIQASEGSSTLVRRAVGGEDDLSTREYRTGDALRRVHWRATARHGELMVRQEEPRSHAEARIILDTRRSGYADAVPARRRAAESDSFELAVSIAASLALHLTRSGFQAEIVETGSRQLETVAPIEPFLRTLAIVRLREERGEYDRESPLEAASRPDRAHGSVFAIVAEPDEETVARLIVQRQSFDLAIAFVIGWQEPGAAERLRRSGWTVLPVALDDQVDDIWTAAAVAQGSGRVQ